MAPAETEAAGGDVGDRAGPGDRSTFAAGTRDWRPAGSRTRSSGRAGRRVADARIWRGARSLLDRRLHALRGGGRRGQNDLAPALHVGAFAIGRAASFRRCSWNSSIAATEELPLRRAKTRMNSSPQPSNSRWRPHCQRAPPSNFARRSGRLGARETPGRYRTLWLLAALVAVGVAAVFGVRAWAIWRSRSLRRSAYDVARADLDALLMAPRPSESAIWTHFSFSSRASSGCYLENRFGLRSPELTTEEFVEELANSPDLVRSHQRLLREFLNRADLVKFAHLVPDPADVELSLESARSFLEATRGNRQPGARQCLIGNSGIHSS